MLSIEQHVSYFNHLTEKWNFIQKLILLYISTVRPLLSADFSPKIYSSQVPRIGSDCKLVLPLPTWIRKRPKFRFGSGFGWFWQVRFGKNFAEFFVIQFHALLQYTGIKRTDYAILCNKSFSQLQQNSTIHTSTTPFYVVKLSACCGERFYIHVLIL